MHYDAGVGHIGGNLSALDILLTLHHGVMTVSDQFVLSKGHSAGAMYITLWTLGRITDDELKTFHKDNTRLPGHPPAHGLSDVLFATGSLGHGLGLAGGLALAKKLKDQPGRVFCLTSDGEWNEGSCWESLIFARHQGLDNLTLIIDANGLQGFGSTKEVADLDPLADKFKAFKLPTLEVDGHDPAALARALSQRFTSPLVIVVKTRKGCGVSFMENQMQWHYLPMSKSQYEQAVQEVGGSRAQ
jgi:transketolase